MIAVYIIIFGAWITATGYHGNSAASLEFIGGQKDYIVWLVAILILYMLYQVSYLQPVIKPIAVLALLALILKKWQIIQSQAQMASKEFGL